MAGAGIGFAVHAAGGSGGGSPEEGKYKLTTPAVLATDYKRQGNGKTDQDMSDHRPARSWPASG